MKAKKGPERLPTVTFGVCSDVSRETALPRNHNRPTFSRKVIGKALDVRVASPVGSLKTNNDSCWLNKRRSDRQPVFEVECGSRHGSVIERMLVIFQPNRKRLEVCQPEFSCTCTKKRMFLVDRFKANKSCIWKTNRSDNEGKPASGTNIENQRSCAKVRNDLKAVENMLVNVLYCLRP